MDFELKEGISFVINTIVTENDTAIKLGSGNLNVYSTPSMLALMENTSKASVEKLLPDGFSTVGIAVNLKHLKASAVGSKIKCEACLIKVEGKKLFFKVNVWDVNSKIGEGEHIRYIVNSTEFMKNIK